MATDHTAIMQAIAQAAVEAAKAAAKFMATTTGESSSGVGRKLTSMGPKLSGPTLKQPSFDWGSVEKYTELKT